MPDLDGDDRASVTVSHNYYGSEPYEFVSACEVWSNSFSWHKLQTVSLWHVFMTVSNDFPNL